MKAENGSVSKNILLLTQSFRRNVIAGIIAFAAVSTAHAGLLGLSSTYPANLYSISETTGAATLITTLTNVGASFTGLEVLNGTIYATDIFPDYFSFGTIDPSTGVFTVINNQGGSLNWHGLAGNESANVLYTIDLNDGNKLKSVTPGGVITTIGTGAGIDGRGMAYDNTKGILYATGGTGLYSVDTTSGISTLIGNMGLNTNLFGLAYDELAGVLYGNDGTNGNLYTLDVTTGAATLIGANSASAIDGLAWEGKAVPEPMTLSLVGIGLAGIGFMRRRRRNAAC